MTVSTTTSKVSYAGNGSTTAFAVGFYFLASADLKVTLRAADGTETVKTLGTHYTVTGAGNPAGGTVTMLTAPATGQTIVVSRNAPLTQVVDYQPNDPFPAATHEQALDKLTMITQQLQEQVDRSAKLPITSTSDADALVADIERIASSADNLDTVANNITAVNTNATNIVAIQNASTNATNAATSASAAASSASAASTSAGTASTQATNAANSATAASNSAALAAASAASGLYSAVQDKSANYTVVAGDAGDLLRVSTGSGAVTITLPAISTVSDGFKIAIVKWTGDANAVTVARSGSDTINGATSANIGAQYTQTTFVADFETSQWFAATSGLGATNVAVDVFSGNGSTTAFTLSGDPGSKNNTLVTVSGVYQAKSTYSLSGTTLTFSTAPPSGSSNIEVVWTQPLAIGTPSDGTVTSAKLTSAQIKLPNAVNEANNVTLASASTVAIGAAGANTIDISGTTTITAFDTIAAGSVRRLIFAGALTLTHNATSLILPGAANITTAAGDVAQFVSLGSGNWRCFNYTKANGQAVVASASYVGPNSQVFTAGGTFTIPSGITKLKVTVVGGGGGAGGMQAYAACFAVQSGGGGGGGASIQYLTGVTPGNTLTVTVGAAGTGGVGGGSATAGGTGGTSSVASGTQTISTISATGGSGGGAFIAGSGGAPGTGSGGTVNAKGGTGGGGATGGPWYTAGGGSLFSGGGYVDTAGLYGAGAGGASNGNQAGKAGGAGVVVFEW